MIPLLPQLRATDGHGSQNRRGEWYVNRDAIGGLQRSYAGRDQAHRQALRDRLPKLRQRFGDPTVERALFNAIGGGDRSAEYIHNLPRIVQIALTGSSYERFDGVNVDALVEQLCQLDDLDREALVRACQWGWSRLNKPEPPGPPGPGHVFDEIL
jgi:hypothetical protein